MNAPVMKPWAPIEQWLWSLHTIGTIREYQMIGSTYTLGQGRDIDFAVLVDDQSYFHKQPEWLVGDWEREGADHYEGNIFVSYRQGDINIIVMEDLDVYTRFMTAMEVCKVLKLQTRRERVLVCRIVRDGMDAAQAESIVVPGFQE